MDRPGGLQIIGANLSVRKDLSIFARALETLAIKAFGDMGQTARLRIIRDRFVAGHNSCELRRHLDSMPPETPIRDIVDRCLVWESHADSDVRRASKPGPDQTFPTYMVSGSDRGMDDLRMAALHSLRRISWRSCFGDCWLVQLRRLRPRTPKPEPPMVEQLLQRLLAGTQVRQPVPAAAAGSSDLETLLQSLLPGKSGTSVATSTGRHTTGSVVELDPRTRGEVRRRS